MNTFTRVTYFDKQDKFTETVVCSHDKADIIAAFTEAGFTDIRLFEVDKLQAAAIIAKEMAQ